MTGTPRDWVLIAAADSGYYTLLLDMIESVRAQRGLEDAPIAVFDLGLDTLQRAALMREGIQLLAPHWHLGLDGRGLPTHHLGLLVRPFLRDYLPGYRRYLWLDADAWIQDGAAIERLLAGARATGLAVVHEREPSYRFQAWLQAWTLKHFILGCGAWSGIRLMARPHLNAGIFCLEADAPHWESWQAHLARAVSRTGRIAPYDQFALNAAVHGDGLPAALLDPIDNWICDRGPPLWDAAARRFCRPRPPFTPLAILHLAGPAKTARYALATREGRRVEAALTYRWVRTNLHPAAGVA
ncbi:MAG: hypothetical protein JNK67_26270 [Alphaproteobacteria bacterium]|nr:hypothetical protein [Alphaproteobacteria bacterium]